MIKKVIIIGCGFAGLAAAKKLRRHRSVLEVTVIDPKKTFDFLPLLPDVLSGRVSSSSLRYPIGLLAKKYAFRHVGENVVFLDPGKRILRTEQNSFSYDYLLIASGARTNFYHRQDLKDHAYPLDRADDAQKIRRALEGEGIRGFLVCGGGYTGIEIAAHLGLYFSKKKEKKDIIIVEKQPSILGMLPDEMKAYAAQALNRFGISVRTGSSVEKVLKDQIFLSDGTVLDRHLLIWASGVKTSDFIENLSCDKTPQGRIKVDPYLKLDEHCFVAGDACGVPSNGSFLRMAVQFSIAEGRSCAENITRSVFSRPMVEFKPVDLGYILPMTRHRACGTVLNMKVKGMGAEFLHYAMCAYRSEGLRNRWSVLRDLLKGGFR